MDSPTVEDPLDRLAGLIRSTPLAVCSLAPSYRHLRRQPGEIVDRVRSLGFAAIEETISVLPRLVVERQKRLEAGPRTLVASSCPVVVRLVEEEFPWLKGFLEASASPMVLHAQSIRARYGEGAAVACIGPCHAKKLEAQAYRGLINQVLTFSELNRTSGGERVGAGPAPNAIR